MKKDHRRLLDVPSAILLALIYFVVTQRLFATDWAPGLEIALLLTLFGAAIGMALGASRFRRAVFWIATGYSLTLIPMTIAMVLYEKTPWLERMISAGGRLGHSLLLFFSSQKVPDTILFVVFIGIGFWFISLLGGYTLIRKGDLAGAVLPAGIVLMIIQAYDSTVGDRVVVIALYAFLCLLLLGRIGQVRKRSSWKELRVSYSSESWTDLNISVLVAALLIVVLAWILPVKGRPLVTAQEAWENISQPFQDMREKLANAITGLNGYKQEAITELYGETLALGQKASLGDGIYLRIRVPLGVRVDRYYWRVRTYDTYKDSTWNSEYGLTEPFTPDQPSLKVANTEALASEFIFTTPQMNLAALVTPARPIWISRPAVLTFTPATANAIDPLMFRPDPAIRIGERYTVHAVIFNPTILELQKAGVLYPGWVQNHYLQLPADLSPQIRDLAKRITKDSETPYEKAQAVTEYLRTNITYSTSVNTPQNGIDPLSWFLFHSRSGFCNYYATAEVILLRSAGVPARLVAGCLSCFRLAERGASTVITDPYDGSETGYSQLKLNANIVTISHDAPGHSCMQAVNGDPYVVTGPGEYEVNGVFITGIQTGVQKGPEDSRNTLYVFDFDSLTIVHLGDLNRVPTQAEVEAMGQVNIALLPVGGGNSLNAARAAEVVSLLEPNIVIPMHYATPGCLIPLDGLNKFLKEMGISEIGTQSSIKVSKVTLPEETKIIVLDRQQG